MSISRIALIIFLFLQGIVLIGYGGAPISFAAGVAGIIAAIAMVVER